jgi:hypothetical protein
MRLGHFGLRLGALEAGQRLLQHLARDARQQQLAALGEQLELVERVQHGRSAGLEQGVGEVQVLRVVGHGHRHVVVAHAAEEQHDVVVEVVAQLVLQRGGWRAPAAGGAARAPLVTGTRVTTFSRRLVSLLMTEFRPTW